jgi:ParB-like protein
MPKKPPETLGIIYRMPLEDLHPHPLNPYGVRDDPAMQELMGSVKENGVLIPAIARPRKEGGYELISGHRRKYACEQLGQDTMPVMVLNLKDDDAIIRMIDSNIQRENILPSERAKAYRLKMEAVKRKAGRPQKGDEKKSPSPLPTNWLLSRRRSRNFWWKPSEANSPPHLFPRPSV